MSRFVILKNGGHARDPMVTGNRPIRRRVNFRFSSRFNIYISLSFVSLLLLCVVSYFLIHFISYQRLRAFPFNTSINRMQIRRTTQTAPGTNSTKARLVVGLRCLILIELLQKSLAGLFYFPMPTSLWVPECHQKGGKQTTEGENRRKERSSRPPKEQ